MKVLFATDGEAHSDAAERLLVRSANREALEVTVFSVTTYHIDPNEHAENALERARERTRQLVSETAQRLQSAGFRVAEATSEGDPGAEIVRKVEAEGFDMAVVGAGRHSFLRARLLGTTSSYLLHNSPTSVMVVHECSEKDDRVKVLVATDGSEHAENAVRTFSRWVDPTRSEVTVTSVAQPDPGEAQEQIDKVIAMLEAEGIRASGELHTGSPAGTILTLADEGDYDLVVLGSLGRGPLRRALMGSVSDHVASHSPAALVDRRR